VARDRHAPPREKAFVAWLAFPGSVTTDLLTSALGFISDDDI